MVKGVANSLPFEQYPPTLIIEIVYNVIFWLNSLPHKDGVHVTISARKVLTGLVIDYSKHCKVTFVTYI